LHHRKMSCSSLSYPECGVARPSPVSGSCNEPCVRQCPDSEVVIRPSPVVVTLPGPILSTFPQQSGVGAVGAPEETFTMTSLRTNALILPVFLFGQIIWKRFMICKDNDLRRN
uniref:Keratin n=1 Tax=Chrysemys picta bellii TaxID=8478 RepID=A0A8C3FD36_CHRPI